MRTLGRRRNWVLATGLAAALVAIVASGAIGAGPYSKLAEFTGNKKACGATKATGCTFNVKTLNPLQFRTVIAGVNVRIECQLNGKGSGWNPGGSPPAENDSVDSFELISCVYNGAPKCIVSATASGLPWKTMATTDGKGNFADQVIIPSNGLKFSLSGTCPLGTGSYVISGEENAEVVNTSEGEPECNPATYAHCTYEKFNESSGKLPVKKEEKEVGTAFIVGEAFFVCTSGGACTEKENQIAIK